MHDSFFLQTLIRLLAVQALTLLALLFASPDDSRPVYSSPRAAEVGSNDWQSSSQLCSCCHERWTDVHVRSCVVCFLHSFSLQRWAVIVTIVVGLVYPIFSLVRLTAIALERSCGVQILVGISVSSGGGLHLLLAL